MWQLPNTCVHYDIKLLGGGGSYLGGGGLPSVWHPGSMGR